MRCTLGGTSTPKPYKVDHDFDIIWWNIINISQKPQKNVKNRWIRLKYRAYVFGNTSIQFPTLENGILKKKIIILGLIEKKLVVPPPPWPPSWILGPRPPHGQFFFVGTCFKSNYIVLRRYSHHQSLLYRGVHTGLF